MGVLRMDCFVVLFILLCALLAPSSLGNMKNTEEVLLSQLIDAPSGRIDEDMAKLVWINCRHDLIHMKEAVETIDLGFLEEMSSSSYEIYSRSRSLANENMQKIIYDMHPQLKKTLLDCLRKNNPLLLSSGEEVTSNNFYTKYLKSLFSKPDAPRRKLGTELIRATSSVSAPESSPKSSGKNTVIIAVAVTASATFLIAAVVFCCCSSVIRGRGGAGKNDNRPLLSLSMTDHSVGSSRQSFNIGDSVKQDMLVQQEFKNSSHKRASSHDGKSYFKSDETSVETLDTSSNIGATLPPPPGRAPLPPLKPPGKVIPLPPEPPAALKAQPGNSRPPPPRPPAPSPPGRSGPPPRPPAPPPSAKLSPAIAGSPSPVGPPPPPPPGPRAGPRPPPPPMGAPRPPPGPRAGPRPPVGNSSSSEAGLEGDAAAKSKLKPFFWDKVQANTDNSMVWHQLKAGSFQFNEEMIETLFGSAPADKNKDARKKAQDPTQQFVQIIDSKKAHNISILLRALNATTEEVCDALIEGNELPPELLHTLLKMAPTADEELKLRTFSGELSQLGPAERFLKALVGIPFAFKRLESLLLMGCFQEEVAAVKEAFATLEVACKELRKSRLFLKLLEAVLKTGNRMNDGTFRGGAQAFKLDTLLKLADVKGKDGKTTLLHFVVLEIIRTEGVRAARVARESKGISNIKSEELLLKENKNDSEEYYRNLGLQVVSGLGNDLENVKKAANIDADTLTGTVARLGHGLVRARDFLKSEMRNVEDDNGFHLSLKSFVNHAEGDVMLLLEEEKRIMTLVKNTGEYFHGNAGKDEGLRLFSIVRDFLIMLDKACKDVKERPPPKKEAPSIPSSSDTQQSPLPDVRPPSSSDIQPSPSPSPDVRQRLSAITDRRIDSDSSDDENP